MQVWKIDEDGFYTFKTYEVEKPNEFEITTPCKTCEEDDFYKPKWTGEKWIEGWTEEEIEKWKEDDKIDNCLDQTKTNEQLTVENNRLWDTVNFLLKDGGFVPKESEVM